MKPSGEGLGDQETPPPNTQLVPPLPHSASGPCPALLGPWVGAELTCVGLGVLGQAGGQQSSLGRPGVSGKSPPWPPWREEGLVLARKPTDTLLMSRG